MVVFAFWPHNFGKLAGGHMNGTMSFYESRLSGEYIQKW